MSKLIPLTALSALLLFLLPAQSRAQNIMVNGDFENGTFSEYGDNLPNGWGLSPTDNSLLSNCDVSSVVNPAKDEGPESGAYYMTFQSTETDGSQDCLYQYLPTVIGQKYNITFSVALTSGTLGPDAYLDPEWDSGGTDDTYLRNSYYYYPGSTTTGPAPYETFSFTETASKTSTLFYFHGVDADGGSIEVDNVSVTPVSAVPEPSELALLALGCAGLFEYRTRRKKSPSFA
jgi:hypothetical protein